MLDNHDVPKNQTPKKIYFFSSSKIFSFFRFSKKKREFWKLSRFRKWGFWKFWKFWILVFSKKIFSHFLIFHFFFGVGFFFGIQLRCRIFQAFDFWRFQGDLSTATMTNAAFRYCLPTGILGFLPPPPDLCYEGLIAFWARQIWLSRAKFDIQTWKVSGTKVLWFS